MPRGPRQGDAWRVEDCSAEDERDPVVSVERSVSVTRTRDVDSQLNIATLYPPPQPFGTCALPVSRIERLFAWNEYDARVPRSQPPVWTCPKCGARLITRNLWHSCGRFTLEALFARSDPPVLPLAVKFVDILRTLGDVQVIPQKTRLVCVARVRFAGLTPRKGHFVASFALHR